MTPSELFVYAVSLSGLIVTAIAASRDKSAAADVRLIDSQAKRIAQLEGELKAAEAEGERLERELAAAQMELMVLKARGT